MLDILRKVFDFSDWQVNHPGEPAPGDMLDASFDAQDSKINEIIARLDRILRSDDLLANGSVHADALSPQLIEKIAYNIKSAFEAQMAAAIAASVEAKTALAKATDLVLEAKTAANRAFLAQNALETDQSGAKADAEQALSETRAVLAKIEALGAEMRAIIDDWDDAEAPAQAWAESSRLWAEHMPDTLPDNALKIMDITGDHWSSRWWANKATNAFGMLSQLYLGVHEDPPDTDMTGGPIMVGSIYYNSETHQAYVWTGTAWEPFWTPQRAVTAALYYRATAGQTVVTTSTADMNGNSYLIDSTRPEPVDVFLNGIKLIPDLGGAEGDYVYSSSAMTVTFARALRVGDIVNLDIYVPPPNLQPISTTFIMLLDISGTFNGTTTTFLIEQPGGAPVIPSKPEELFVSLDGTWQQPGWSYTVNGAASQITFAEAPLAGAKCFILWILPPP